jgi:hypothetical protein
MRNLLTKAVPAGFAIRSIVRKSSKNLFLYATDVRRSCSSRASVCFPASRSSIPGTLFCTSWSYEVMPYFTSIYRPAPKSISKNHHYGSQQYGKTPRVDQSSSCHPNAGVWFHLALCRVQYVDESSGYDDTATEVSCKEIHVQWYLETRSPA